MGSKDSGGEPPVMAVLADKPRGRRRRAARNAQTIDDRWRANVREQMERHNISLSELAAIIGCSKGTLHAALDLKEQQPTFRYRDALHEAIQRIIRGESPPVAPPDPPPRRRRSRLAGAAAALAPGAPAAVTIDDNLRIERLRSVVDAMSRTMTAEELEALAYTASQLVNARRRT